MPIFYLPMSYAEKKEVLKELNQYIKIDWFTELNSELDKLIAIELDVNIYLAYIVKLLINLDEITFWYFSCLGKLQAICKSKILYS